MGEAIFGGQDCQNKKLGDVFLANKALRIRKNWGTQFRRICPPEKVKNKGHRGFQWTN